jgi:transcriptional/translational regulatory protein YebC/TACO1
MIKLGWIDHSSERAQEIVRHFSKIEQLSREIDKVRTQSTKTWLNLNPRTKLALKKHKNALKMCNLWTKIEKEDSLRSKIISSLNSDYYARGRYSRQDFRAIMLLK